MEEFSEKIKETRREMKLSQKELSNIVGVSDKTIYRWENGTSCPSIKQKEVIAESLGFRKDYFYNEFEEKNIIRNNIECKTNTVRKLNFKNVWTVCISVFFSILFFALIIMYVYYRVHCLALSEWATKAFQIKYLDICTFAMIFIIGVVALCLILKTRKNKKRGE